MGHIINLAVQSFLFHNAINTEELQSYDEMEKRGEQLSGKEETVQKFRLLGPLGKLHNILVYSRSTTALVKEFLELAERLIPLDNRTRWNSWYLCLDVALVCQAAIDMFTKNHWAKLQKDFITPEEWKKLSLIKEFFQPFHKATLNTQGHNATLDSVHFTVDVLLRYFKVALVRCFSSFPFKL